MSSDAAPPADAAEAPIATLSAAALRAALVTCCTEDPAPPARKAAAAAAGVSGTDAFLCHLVCSLNAAVESVAAAAEAARSLLREIRETRHLEDLSHLNELEEGIASAEFTKIVALERELCAVDAALERLRAERGAAADAAVALSDSELVARHAALVAGLDAADARLLLLPTTVVEPPCVGLVVDEAALEAGTAAFGRIVAPRAVTAGDLTIETASRRTYPGDAVRMRLALQGAPYASQSAEELGMSLGAAAAATHIEAFLETPGDMPQPLQAGVSTDVPGRCLVVSFLVPPAARAGSSVCVASVAVSGLPVADLAAGPLSIPVRRGIHPPVRLGCSTACDVPDSLCISRAGLLFVPCAESSDVLVYDCDGSQLPGLSVERLGLSTHTRWTAFSDGDSPAVLLADRCGSDRIVAIDSTTLAVRWATALGLLYDCSGLTALPAHGVVIASSYGDDALYAHRLSDGERVGTLEVPQLGDDLAADSETGEIFGTVMIMSSSERLWAVARFSWSPSTGLQSLGLVKAAGEREKGRPLAVAPPAPGQRVSYLIVGTWNRPELLVLALPGLNLVHTHTLEGMQVMALAVDPWGGAIAVSDLASRAVHVLAWPLPGMPALE